MKSIYPRLGKPVTEVVAQLAGMYAFLFKVLGIS